MASLHRTFARNIARERMIAAGARHINRKHRVNANDAIRRSKAYRYTDQSMFGQLWRQIMAAVVTANRKETMRAERKARNRARAPESRITFGGAKA